MTKPIYRADHCGSLVRPQELRTARTDYLHGKITKPQLREIEDRCIVSALKLQQDAGLKIYSDGEFRRDFWLSAVSDEFFDGMENHGIDYTRHPYLRGKEIKDSEFVCSAKPDREGQACPQEADHARTRSTS